jgi:lysophospholipase L1-like esterase
MALAKYPDSVPVLRALAKYYLMREKIPEAQAKSERARPPGPKRPGNAQTDGVDIPAARGHYRIMHGKIKKQFSFTRATPRVLGAFGRDTLISPSVRLGLAVWVLSCCAIAATADQATPPQSGKVNTAIVPEPGGSETWHAKHRAMSARAKQGRVDLIYIGDSIVGNWNWDGKPVWDYYYAKRNGLILGISGDRTQQVLWRLQHGNIDGISPKLAIVMIGQNNGPFNTGEEIGAGVAAIVQTLREKLPETKILVLAIFFRGEKPTKERAVLAKANEVASKLADEKHVFYMDVNHLFLRPDGSISASLMPDYEHPSEEGCRVWAVAIEPKVAELMGDTPTPKMPARPEAKGHAAQK